MMTLANSLRTVGGSFETTGARAHLKRIAPVAAFGALFGLVFLAYGHILNDWFLSDDFWYLRASQTASADFALNSFDYTANGPVPEATYRPLYPLVFLLTYKAFGLTAWQYHLLSISVHTINVTLVWLLARKLTQRDAIAYTAAFVFALHPTYAPNVAWITSNVSMFALVFSLGSTLLFLRFLDNGDKRWLYYSGSLVSLIVAMLIHPEAIGSFAVLILAYFLWRAERWGRLSSPSTFLPVLPYAVVALCLIAILQYVRAHNVYQQALFGFGRHMFDYFLLYVASAGNPFGIEDSPWHWRSALPIACVGLVVLWQLIAQSGIDLRVRILITVWFAFAILPLTTYKYAAEGRKLYAAGAPFSLLIAMAAVTAWDGLRSRVRTFNVPAVNLGYAAVAAALIPLAIILPLRIRQTTDQAHMAEASYLYVDSTTYKVMIDQVRSEYPRLPAGARLDLAGVPWKFRVFNALDTRLIDAIRIYYGDVEVVGVVNAANLPPPAGPERYLVEFTCPPVCGPPPPAAWLGGGTQGAGE